MGTLTILQTAQEQEQQPRKVTAPGSSLHMPCAQLTFLLSCHYRHHALGVRQCEEPAEGGLGRLVAKQLLVQSAGGLPGVLVHID